MRVLLDTQVFIWLINADKRIGAVTAEMSNDRSNEINLSYFSLFEMKIKATIGKLSYDDSIVSDLSKMGVELIMPSNEALEKYRIFNDTNKDPFDNILIATALSERCVFVTSDSKILGEQLPGLRLYDAHN